MLNCFPHIHFAGRFCGCQPYLMNKGVSKHSYEERNHDFLWEGLPVSLKTLAISNSLQCFCDKSG